MSARRRAGARSPGRGGARRGAGRKAGVLPPDLARRKPDLPPLDRPDTQILLSRYWTVILALLTEARLRGEGVGAIDELAREIRANAAAAGKVIPHDAIFSAAKLLKDDDDELGADESPDEEDRPEGAASALRADE